MGKISKFSIRFVSVLVSILIVIVVLTIYISDMHGLHHDPDSYVSSSRQVDQDKDDGTSFQFIFPSYDDY
jgi:hypothetical protein